MSALLALQAALVTRLTTATVITALVPAANVIDSSVAPKAFPAIVIGEAQEVPAGTTTAHHFTIYLTLHLWDQASDLASVKSIAGAVRQAIRGWRPDLGSDRCLDLMFDGARYVRDPDPSIAHAVVSIEATVLEN